MDRKRKRSSASMDGYECLSEDDDDLHAGSASLDPNDMESRKHQRQNHSEIEKRRRDKMNTYITELSALIPMCSAMNRKLDKLTVLRMAVQHMKSVRGSSKMCSEVSHKPSFISDDELKHLILNVADGFLLVVGCDRGRILYVSQSVKNILHFSQADLIGQSLFDIIHPRDISKVKEQLSSSDLTPRERFIDAKTMMPVKTEVPQKQSQLCSGARRSFFCRMKTSSKAAPPDMTNPVRVKKEPLESHYHRKRRSDAKHFNVIHCTGYLKSWSTAKIGLEDDGEADNDSCSLSCLVAVGRMQTTPSSSLRRTHQHNHCQNQSAGSCASSSGVGPNHPSSLFPNASGASGHIKVRPMEYMSRLNIDGKFSYVDERATVILGYLPQELLGTSVYEYYHQDDIPGLGQVHRKVLSTKEKVETDVYRFKLKDGKFLHLKSTCFGFRNPWTKEVEYIVSTNSVVQNQEVSSSGQSVETTVILGDDEDFSHLDFGDNSQSKGVMIPGLLGGTRPGAGRIGKQIAEECMEQLSKPPHNGADSSDVLSTAQQQQQQQSPRLSSSSSSAAHRSSQSCLPPPHTSSSSSLAKAAATATTTSPSPATTLTPLTASGIPGQLSSGASANSSISGEPRWDVSRHMPASQNGISVKLTSSAVEQQPEEPSLFENVLQEQAMDSIQNPGNDGNDEAALAFLMSLLEADAGLGGPVDFNDLPWPL